MTNGGNSPCQHSCNGDVGTDEVLTEFLVGAEKRGSLDREWKRLLAGGFAFQTAPFTAHPLDAKRARKMFFASIRADASIDDIKNEASAYLTKLNYSANAAKAEVSEVERFVRGIKPTTKNKRYKADYQKEECVANNMGRQAFVRLGRARHRHSGFAR